MCNYALLPEEHGNDIEGDRAKTEGRYPGILAWYDGLHEKGVFRDTTMTGENGYKLHAVYAPADGPAEGTAVVVHGYTDNHICFLNLVRMYRDSLHYNVMVPDLHYHGYSEGRAVQMGWLDRLDVRRWAEMAHDIWNDDFLVVHGVSMGGATTMMLSGDDMTSYTAENVREAKMLLGIPDRTPEADCFDTTVSRLPGDGCEYVGIFNTSDTEKEFTVDARGATAAEMEILRRISSGSLSVVVVPSSTRPWRSIAPA